jgi:hypothetical protein
VGSNPTLSATLFAFSHLQTTLSNQGCPVSHLRDQTTSECGARHHINDAETRVTIIGRFSVRGVRVAAGLVVCPLGQTAKFSTWYL